jgi:putative membrane protein
MRHFAIPFAVLALAPAAAAHTAAENSEAWSFEPGVVTPLVISALMFAIGAVRRRARPGWSKGEFVAFIAGWLMLVIALISPIHKLGEELFSVHMSQHELLMNAAAPLLVLSRPMLWLLWSLPIEWRESAGGVAKRPRIAALWLAVSAPLFAWLLHGATLWLWHIPLLYQACLEHEWVHSLQHLTFLGTALLFWWTLINGRGHLRNGIAVIYCFTTAVHTSILGALMTFSQQLWYPIYQTRTAAFHLTPLQDQQLGGLIMWVPAGVIYVVLGLWLLMAWMKESERRVRYTEAGSAHSPRERECGPLLSSGDRHA